MQKLPAIVLAGERGNTGSTLDSSPTVITEILGITMVERVINTLSSCNQVDKICMVGPDPETASRSESIARIVGRNNVSYIEPTQNPIKSAELAFETTGTPTLITTADHPLLTNSIIKTFLQQGYANGSDFIVGLVPQKYVERRYPKNRRTVLRFKDAKLCGSNLFLLKTEKCADVLKLWTKIEKNRKTPWRVVNYFGFNHLLKYKLGQLRSEEAFEVLSEKTGCSVGFVPIRDARAAIDVDCQQDLSLVTAILKADEKSDL